MKTKKKTILAFLLIIILALTNLLAGCQGDEPGTTDTPATDEAPTATDKPETEEEEEELSSVVTPPGQFPIVTEEYMGHTISLMFQSNATVTDYVDNDYTRYVEERTGLKLELIPLNPENAIQQVELMVSSNEELADIISFNLSYVSRNSMYEQGIILPLDELFEKYAHWWYIMARRVLY
ncbi:MAG: hypothetical protein ACOX22_05380 [Caldicoprobacterales bacterium]